MWFLIDNSCSPILVVALRECGHEAPHVRDFGMGAAPDEAIASKAVTLGAVIVAADVDFGTISVRLGAPAPSVILFRLVYNRPARMRMLLEKHLDELIPELSAGAIAVIEDAGIRVHRLT